MSVKDKKRLSINKKKLGPQERYGVPKGFWFRLTLALLAIYSLYIIVGHAIGTGNLPISFNPVVLLDPSGSSLLIVIFSALYFYCIARKIATSTLTKLCAYTLVILAVVALVATFVITSKPYYSTDDFYLVFSVLYHNPWTTVINSITSLAGVITLIAMIAQRNK